MTSSCHRIEDAVRKIERLDVRWCAAGLLCSELLACQYSAEKPELPEPGTSNPLATSHHVTKERKPPAEKAGMRD